VNVDGLASRLNSLDDETITELFGVADAQQLRNLAADISNRSKYLDADALSPRGTPQVLQQLRAAATADEQIDREYRDSVIAPFMRGENGAAARINSDELVPWLYRKAQPGEARAIGQARSAMRESVERGVVADIIENAISRGGGDMSSVRRLVTGGADPASSQGIAELLGAGGDVASRQQGERVSALVRPEYRQALGDLALIAARRQERDATSSAIGGACRRCGDHRHSVPPRARVAVRRHLARAGPARDISGIPQMGLESQPFPARPRGSGAGHCRGARSD